MTFPPPVLSGWMRVTGGGQPVVMDSCMAGLHKRPGPGDRCISVAQLNGGRSGALLNLSVRIVHSPGKQACVSTQITILNNRQESSHEDRP